MTTVKQMEISNLEKYRKDLDNLIKESKLVTRSLLLACYGEKEIHKSLIDSGDTEEAARLFVKDIKPFRSSYQHWYSEALPLIKQLLPDRAQDFVKLYEKPKTRKSIDFENYRIEDACQGLQSSFGGQIKADATAAISLLDQQIAIVEAVNRRFESSLFDIKQLVQADLFDSELDTARGLLKAGYNRASGAIAGVVLEGHLKQVCDKHSLQKKSGTISVLNDTLKAAGIIDLAQSRHIQFLGDIRNKCSHKNSTEPTQLEVEDLLGGVDKVIKTTF